MAAAAEVSLLQECGCKGIRTCLICERQRHRDPPWQICLQVRTRKRVIARKSIHLNGKLRPSLPVKQPRTKASR
uniref:AlkB homolog 4, lysine demethylase n=1 Tax=Mus musculus TaxID=10090 RepID=D6RFB6_MOUSE